MSSDTLHVQVESYPDLVRDTNSHAIINRNRSAYDKAKKRAKLNQIRIYGEIRIIMIILNSFYLKKNFWKLD